MIQVLDDRGNHLDEYLLVRYGATAQEWEEASNANTFVEFIDGKLIVHSPASLVHSRLFDLIHRLLGDFVERRHLGEVLCGPFTMELSLERKFEPDIMFLSHETRRRLADDRLRGPADLAIEIASKSTRAYDRSEKRECYRVGGVREYWMVDPYDKRVIVDRPAGHEIARVSTGRVDCETCPDLWLLAEWLWQDPLPAVADCLKTILGERA